MSILKRAKVSEKGKVVTSVDLEEKVYTVLKNYSQKEGSSMSGVMNKALKMFFFEKKNELGKSEAEQWFDEHGG